MAHQVHKELLALEVIQAHPGQKDRQVQQDLLDSKEIQETLVHQELPDLLGHEETLVLLVPPAVLARLDPLVRMDFKVHLGQLVP